MSVVFLVTGDRSPLRPDLIRSDLRAQFWNAIELRGNESVLVVHGAAEGVDTIADQVAAELGLDRKPFPATAKYGPWPARGPIRNRAMVLFVSALTEYADKIVLAYPPVRMKSGTRNCMRLAHEAGLPVHDRSAAVEMSSPLSGHPARRKGA